MYKNVEIYLYMLSFFPIAMRRNEKNNHYQSTQNVIVVQNGKPKPFGKINKYKRVRFNARQKTLSSQERCKKVTPRSTSLERRSFEFGQMLVGLLGQFVFVKSAMNVLIGCQVFVGCLRSVKMSSIGPSSLLCLLPTWQSG